MATSNRTTLLYLLAALGLATIVYATGLNGPFLFDDHANLSPILDWLEGSQTWQHILFGNLSGPLGRPVSIASFMGNAWLFGTEAFSFKAINLLIHLVCSALLFGVLQRLCRLDPLLAPKAPQVAIAITAIWLLHPMFASTVLYTVQRMAMLSSMFMFAALLFYLIGRIRLDRGRRISARILLYLLVPVATVLAGLSKENGLLAIALCGLIEWIYFRPAEGKRRPKEIRIYFLVACGLPALAALAALSIAPDALLGGYANRSFTLTERLLTQPRVLFDYIGQLLLPSNLQFSLYRDDYVVSTGLFSPWTTAASLLGWGLLITAALVVRTMLPSFTAGIGIFLIGHSVESGIFPLLMYFEHRNYLPAFGILLSATTLTVAAWRVVSPKMQMPHLVAGAAMAILLMTLAFATHGRAKAWQSHEYLLTQSLAHYPDSRLARMGMANLEMTRKPPRPDAARDHYLALLNHDRPSSRLLGHLGVLMLACHVEGSANSEQVRQAFSIVPESIEADLFSAIESLAQNIEKDPCDGLTPVGLADQLVPILDRTGIPPEVIYMWRLRFVAARLYLSADLDDLALRQAQLAWDTGKADLVIGTFISALHLRAGRYDLAEDQLDEIEPRLQKHDVEGRNLMNRYRGIIEESRNPS